MCSIHLQYAVGQTGLFNGAEYAGNLGPVAGGEGKPHIVGVVAQVVGMVADESVLTDGKVDLGKLQPVMFDSSATAYRVIGENVGGAWNAGGKFAE